jgi:hypothetical protein
LSDTTPSGTLKIATLKLLRELPRERSLTDVANGCGLSPAWLSAFVRGEIASPSVDKVQCVWEYLTGRALNV